MATIITALGTEARIRLLARELADELAARVIRAASEAPEVLSAKRVARGTAQLLVAQTARLVSQELVMAVGRRSGQSDAATAGLDGLLEGGRARGAS